MNKTEFIRALTERLSFLPREEVDERIAFYCEMIEDRMDEGLTVQQAIAEIGSVDEIAAQIVAEIPLAKLAKQKIKSKRRLGAWEIILLVLGSPIWLSLLISLFAVGISLYVSLWAVVISLWAVFIAVVVCAPACMILGVLALPGFGMTGLAAIGIGSILAGIAILLCMGCKAVTKATAMLAKKAVKGIKLMFLKKEAVA